MTSLQFSFAWAATAKIHMDTTDVIFFEGGFSLPLESATKVFLESATKVIFTSEKSLRS